MSELALLVGIKEEELSKALIRGLPPKLRWHVVSFNPTSLGETIQRILLGEATLSFTEEKTEINEISGSFVVLCTRLEERVGRLEDLNKAHVTKEKPQYQRPLCFRCGKRAISRPSVFVLESTKIVIVKEVEDLILLNTTQM